MDVTTRLSDPTLPDAESGITRDRRRPGRAEVDPALVPLLREAGDAGLSNVERERLLEKTVSDVAVDRDGEGNVIKGLLFGLTLSLPFWLVTLLVCVLVLR